MQNPSPIVYVEIPAPDIEKAGSFYNRIFNWKIDPSDLTKQAYWMFNSGEDSLLGAFDTSKPVTDGGVVIYLKVDDINATLEKIKASGGNVVMDKFDIGGNYGFSAIFTDPNGNHMGLWSKS